MKLANWFVIGMAALLALVGASLGQGPTGSGGVPVAFDVVATDGVTQAELTWAADPGLFYEIYATTNLASGPWTLAVAEPLSSTNLIGQMQLLSADKSRFFQVRPLDTQGPAIIARYPGESAVGVGRAAHLTVMLSDPSGVDSNAFRLAVNGGAPLLWDSPGVSITANRFTYDPALAATNWGGFAATVTVAFACADLKGNASSAEWSFALEVEPQVSGNLLHLSAPAPLKGTSSRLAMPTPVGVLFLGGLTISEFLPDRIIFNYTGEHGLYVGAILVSHDPSRPFYRRILSLESGPGAGQVTAFTEDVLLTDIVQEGSFSPEISVPVGGQVQALWGDADIDVGIPFSYRRDFAAGVIEWPNVRLRPANLDVDLRGNLLLACEIRNWQVMSLGSNFDAAFDAQLRTGIDVYAEIPFLSRTKQLAPPVTLGVVGGFIGPVPIWIELQFGVDLMFEVSAEGAASFDTGLNINATAQAAMEWTPSGGVTHDYGGTFSVTPVPLEVEVRLSAEANLFVKPRLSALVYSLAGASLDLRYGPGLEVAYTIGAPQAEITLYDKWSVNGELTVLGLSGLPKVTFLESTRPFKTWYWPEVPLSVPAFTLHPSGGAYAAGAAVTLTASASGNPAPSYQWYQNGSLLVGRTAQTLAFTMGASAVGSYHCRASNRRGAANSQSVTLSLPASAPAGMALIPAGSFQMGDNLGDGWEAEVPVHTVYVSAFYIDRTEVSWGKWQEVRTWSSTRGYDIGSVGSGKADNHPVHSVNWYDCIKWLNARSEMEGLTPCYRRGGVVYKAEQHDDIVCAWSANGYRLPTEAEWEKAARGGLSGRRFPWGDTIQHARANYYSSSSYGYDTSPTRGYHPSYETGWPNTSPAGAFAANGYGLYDMAGNVWEWCWDWFDDYPSGSVSNPRGPSSPSPNWGSYRVFRGGSGSGTDYAYRCRVAYRYYASPGLRNYLHIGFRAVRPPGQQ
jgi:sulfatase modifying factor 1